MGLNPGEGSPGEKLRAKILGDSFNGGSPYYAMYHCGYYGVPLEACVEKCRMNGIPLRQKDIRSYQDGAFKRNMGQVLNVAPSSIKLSDVEVGVPFEKMRLSDFPLMPQGWTGTERRFFPCTEENRPMQKWGWSRDYTPQLYVKADAKALSPCGWVGQNMLYQPFVVLDIDGRGHGADDLQVIEFGRRFSSTTFTMEDPAKPGSFHLYFATRRLIPVRHFPWAKLDLMGNAVNAAVYLKNKRPNGLEPRELDDEVWGAMMAYVKRRKEQQV